jgi:branched-chain amino acid transport system substrate-binding protein
MSVARTLCTLCLGLLMAVPAAQAQKKYDTGASDTEIRLGNSFPYSGPASSYGIIGKVFEAYFTMLNERGGINGRKVKVFSYDDQYTAARTVEVTRRMVEQDEVLAVVGTMGTGPNASIQRYLNAKKIPQLFLAAGAARFNDPKTYPWTIGFLPSYEAEGRAFAASILKDNPNAKVAVLYQNDDFGKDLLKALKDGLGSKAAAMVVAEASYELADPTVDSQMVKLKASGADVFVNFSSARAASQAIRKAYDLGWRPRQQFLTLSSAYVKMTLEPAGLDKSMGVQSVGWFKDAVQERWTRDPATVEYRAFMRKYAPNEELANAAGVYAYIVAQLTESVLKNAGDNLTRENLLKQSVNLKDVRFGMMLPGVTLNNSTADYNPVSALQLVRFNGSEFEPVGDVVRVK